MVVDIVNDSGESVDLGSLEAQSAFMLERLRMHPDCELSIALVDEPTMERLHVEHMDEPGSTDVLSFPMDDLVAGGELLSGPGVLGDVIICPAVAERQAREFGHSRDHELAVLLTHGILHLLGHDHYDADEAAEMFRLQGELLEQWGAESR